MTQPNVCARNIAALLIAAILAIQLTAAAPLGLEELLHPFEFLNITQTYDHYSGLIDLFIYILIFVGLAQAILARHYGGTGGHAVAIGVGLCLAFAMLLAEEAFNFNLKSFGPFAAMLIVLLLGITMFGLLHGAGMSKTASASTAYVAIFFTTRAVAPEFFNWLNEAMPLLSVAALIALIAAVVGLLSSVSPHHGSFPGFGGRPTGPRTEGPREARHRQATDAESRALKEGGKPVAKRNLKETGELLKDLQGLREAIRKNGNNPAARGEIVAYLERIMAKERDVYTDIERLKLLHQRLLAFDETVLHEGLRSRLASMDAQARERLKAELHAELQKTNVEKQLVTIEEGMRRGVEAVNHWVHEAAGALQAGRAREAVAAVDKAIAQEKAIRNFAARAKELEKLLLRLTRWERAAEKRMPP